MRVVYPLAYDMALAGAFAMEQAAFYENALGCAAHELNREELICPRLFDNPSLIRNVDPREALDTRNLR